MIPTELALALALMAWPVFLGAGYWIGRDADSDESDAAERNLRDWVKMASFSDQYGHQVILFSDEESFHAVRTAVQDELAVGRLDDEQVQRKKVYAIDTDDSEHDDRV